MKEHLQTLADRLQREADTTAIDWTDLEEAVRQSVRLDMLALTASNLRRAVAAPTPAAGLNFVILSLRMRFVSACQQLEPCPHMSIIGMLEGIADCTTALLLTLDAIDTGQQPAELFPWALLRMAPQGEA